MLTKIALGIGAILVLLVIAIATRPSEFAVERSATMNAPASLIYPHIAEPRAMEAWSPFSNMDPELQKNTYQGPASGVGAMTSWEGGQAGEGRLTVVAVQPDREVDMKLEFRKPMQATNRAVFTLVPAGDATTVTWRLEGSNGFVSKAIGMFMDMDAMVGGQFEKGLGALKVLVEASAAAPKD